MREQFTASVRGLREDIKRIENEEFRDFDKVKLNSTIEKLSYGIYQLQNQGINVTLNLSPLKKETNLYTVFNRTPCISLNMPISGTLEIEGSKSMISIVISEKTSEDEISKPVMKIYLSQAEDKDKGKYDIDMLCFDLEKDYKAIYKLQQYIISVAAKFQYIKKHDIEKSLGCNKSSMTVISPTVIRKPKKLPRL